jgi:hypothetical protein
LGKVESGRRRNDGKDWEAGKEVEIRMFRVGKRERKEGMGREVGIGRKEERREGTRWKVGNVDD